MRIPETRCPSINVLPLIHTVKRKHHGGGLVLRQLPPGGAVGMAVSSNKKLVLKKKMIWKHHFKVQKVHSGLSNYNETTIVRRNQSLKIPVLLYMYQLIAPLKHNGL